MTLTPDQLDREVAAYRRLRRRQLAAAEDRIRTRISRAERRQILWHAARAYTCRALAYRDAGRSFDKDKLAARVSHEASVLYLGLREEVLSCRQIASLAAPVRDNARHWARHELPSLGGLDYLREQEAYLDQAESFYW